MSSEVLVVGAGPVGLALALGLARHGVRSTLVDRKSSISEQSKAPGIHARTLEILDQWGVADEILRRAIFLPSVTIHSARTGAPLVVVPVEELAPECRFAGLCILEQGTTERVLLNALVASGMCEVRFEHELVALRQDGRGVVATLRGRGDAPSEHGFRYLAGCDGSNSTVRRLLESPFDGITYEMDGILADVRLRGTGAELPSPRVLADGERLVLLIRLESGNWRIVSGAPASPAVEETDAVSDETLGSIVELGLGGGEFDRVWSSRFRIHRRCVERFRMGRVLLAGDAAHVNSPVGAQGMNSGIQDAHNLAWKIAAAVGGGDEERLLESYDAERRRLIRTRVNRFTDIATRFVLAPAPVRNLVARGVARAMESKRLRRPLMRRATMLAGRYSSSPLLPRREGAAGARVPDVELGGQEGRSRLHRLVGAGPAVLLIEHAPLPVDRSLEIRTIPIGSDGWTDAQGLLAHRFGTRRVLVVRPDHHVGWAGRPRDAAELERAIRLALGRTGS